MHKQIHISIIHIRQHPCQPDRKKSEIRSQDSTSVIDQIDFNRDNCQDPQAVVESNSQSFGPASQSSGRERKKRTLYRYKVRTMFPW